LLNLLIDLISDNSVELSLQRYSLLLDNAIRQIREKKYYERFLSEPQVSLLGIAFAGKEIGCRIEVL
jgi:hypothetical protein